LIKALEVSSTQLSDISRLAVTYMAKIPIVSFYETRPLGPSVVSSVHRPGLVARRLILLRSWKPSPQCSVFQMSLPFPLTQTTGRSRAFHREDHIGIYWCGPAEATTAGHRRVDLFTHQV
jgi:hypothetical protein